MDAAGALLDGGYIEIRTGAQPASTGTAASGTLLATLPLSADAFAPASAGGAVANAITSDSAADATGTAGWFRAYSSGGTAMIDGAITATGGGGEMELNSTSIVAGGTVSVSAWTIFLP